MGVIREIRHYWSSLARLLRLDPGARAVRAAKQTFRRIVSRRERELRVLRSSSAALQQALKPLAAEVESLRRHREALESRRAAHFLSPEEVRRLRDLVRQEEHMVQKLSSYGQTIDNYARLIEEQEWELVEIRAQQAEALADLVACEEILRMGSCIDPALEKDDREALEAIDQARRLLRARVKVAESLREEFGDNTPSSEVVEVLRHPEQIHAQTRRPDAARERVV